MAGKVDEILALIKNSGSSIDLSLIEPDTSFSQLEMDSLDRMNVFLVIEEKFGISISDDDVLKLDCANDIAEFISKDEAR